MIYCTDVDGVHGGDGKTIEKITNKNFRRLKRSILGAKGVDVTGGMFHKVSEAVELAEMYKIPTYIINGNRKNELFNTLLGKRFKGTKIYSSYLNL